jgi:hypothetical protein
MRIEVTQEHIDRGQRKSCARCPVVLAIRQVSGVVLVYADRDEVDLRRGGKTLTVSLPLKVSRFIDRFDATGPGSVEPFSFDLPIDDFCKPTE